jgi:hypothetical protein
MKTYWVVFAIAVALGLYGVIVFGYWARHHLAGRGPSPVRAETSATEHGRPFHGLGIAYVVGLILLVLGGAVAMGAIIGLLTFPLFISGIALIGIAVERLEGAATLVRWKLLGALLLFIGLFGTMPLAVISSAIVSRSRVGVMSPSWIELLALVAAWVVWPCLICAGVWLRRRPTAQALHFLWLSQSAMYPTITAVSWWLRPFLPQSL